MSIKTSRHLNIKNYLDFATDGCRVLPGAGIQGERSPIMSPKKSEPEADASQGDAEEKRKATTIYLFPEILSAFKKRVIDEPEPGYVIVEEAVKFYLQLRPDVVKALWKVGKDERQAEKRKKALYKAAEDALASQLEKLGLL